MAEEMSAGKKGFVDSNIHADVQDYYGKTVKSTSDIKSDACVAPDKPIPAHICQVLKKVHPDVINRYTGCGIEVPECLEGCRILDLGCGAGRDLYMLSQLVGGKGHVTGIDMTEEQLEVARTHLDYHMKEFGYKNPNVKFVKGFIEALRDAGLEEGSFDVITSNGVVNLTPDKKRVLAEAYSVLKDGGELYFTDVYSSGRLTEEIRKDRVLWGECLSGALWWKDLLLLAEEVGFSPPRLVTSNPINVGNKEFQKVLGDFKFVSATYRLFKVPKGDAGPCQVMYNGSITGVKDSFEFDCHYTFKANEAVTVDGEVAAILTHSRFKEVFTCQPAKAAHQPCGVKPKEGTVDPFELALQLKKQGPGSATGGCCSSQSAACCK